MSHFNGTLMKTIILYGNSKSGKSTVVRLLYYVLLYLGAEILRPRSNHGFLGDFYCILFFKGKKIYLHSLGDTIVSVTNALKDADKLDCDIYISALNNGLARGKQYLKCYSPVYIDKTGNKDDTGCIENIHQIISEIIHR